MCEIFQTAAVHYIFNSAKGVFFFFFYPEAVFVKHSLE